MEQQQAPAVPISVKFVLQNGDVFTKAFNRQAKIAQVKHYLRDVFLNASFQFNDEWEILLMSDVNSTSTDVKIQPLDETMALAEIAGAEELGTIELKVRTTKSSVSYICNRIDKQLIYGHIPTLDVITVHVSAAGNGSGKSHHPPQQLVPSTEVQAATASAVDVKSIVVEIERVYKGKAPWLGGYKNLLNGKLYYHAATQTPIANYAATFYDDHPSESKCNELFRSQGESSRVSRSSQTAAVARTLLLHKNTNTSICKSTETRGFHLQSEWMYRGAFNDLRIKDNVNGKRVIEEEKSAATCVLPRQTMEKWWTSRSDQYAASDSATATVHCHRGGRKMVEMSKQRILVKILSCLNKRNLQIRKYTLRERKIRTLRELAEPIVFTNKNGHPIYVDTICAQLIRNLVHLFVEYDCEGEAVTTTTTTTAADKVSHKISLIQDTILFFRDFPEYEFSRDVLELLTREITLLTSESASTTSINFHLRIEQFIFHFAKQYLRRLIDDENRVYGVRSLSPSSSSPDDYQHEQQFYEEILSTLQKDEMHRFKCFTSSCFKIEVNEMRYLIDKIWSSTKRSDVRVRVIRWDKYVEWNPWNCIVLAEHQAENHLRIEKIREFYSDSFISWVRSKHVLAKIYFSRLL